MTNAAVSNPLPIASKCRDFYDQLTEQGINRFWLARIGGELKCSSAEVQPICDQVEQLTDYDQHEAVFVELNPRSKCIYAAFVHSTVRGQAQGGVRLLDFDHYDQFENLLIDGLRLARGMTEKNALAEIWWGGGKGIICPVDNLVEDFAISNADYPQHRQVLFEDYGRFIASLGGIYITAEDMNTFPEDMKTIHSECRFVTCLPPELGGSSNPSERTAEGTFVSMLAGMIHLGADASAPLRGKTVLLQGAGNVGYALLEMLVDTGAKVVVFEPNHKRVGEIANSFKDSQVQTWDDTSESGFEKFIELEADVFSPNAIGAIVTSERVQRMKIKLIAGAANNQLLTRDLAELLHEKEICYLPDFLINCMGIVNCANEQYGCSESKIDTQVQLLRKRVEDLLDRSDGENSVYDLAIEQSVRLAQNAHPIWPGNGAELVESLTRSNWANSLNIQ